MATANEYTQGSIAGLDDAMTRRLIASVVMTESNGGDLSITNRQGFVGRYQAGAAWLADAGYVDRDRMHASMRNDGVDPDAKGAEWRWAQSGGMTRFLQDPSNWRDGLSLEQYKGSAELQDRAFKTNSDAAYRQALDKGVLSEQDKPERVAGFLKARHIAGYGGAKDALIGRVHRDSNGTSNCDYLHDITRNRDGLDQFMAQSVKKSVDTRARPMPLNDPAHADRSLYQEALRCVQQLDVQHGRTFDQRSEQLAASLVVAARQAGMGHIDHLMLNQDASKLFAVEGAIDSPFKRLAEVPTLQAMNTPMAQSAQAWEHAAQQRSAQEQSRQQNPPPQGPKPPDGPGL